MNRKRILLATGDLPIAGITKLLLEHEGFEVVTATDGEETLQHAQADGTVALILLDLGIPTLNGFQVCKRLKANPSVSKIPIIVFTTSTHWSRLEEWGTELGITDWLKKPFLPQELIEKVRNALGNSRI